eukprot:CAMPEP_0180380954 /NCGR_PEP_ID=MMETSP0989-20121125/26356_1 /TAXON_ID=697907 /ORGANISM="non described non described, Strain CCMP2293" /LENGTH=144 /DNA_ID=CAMNT_0022380535 /DNA_START=260 /DNA_END=694 /DNA_ORIENTATION=-
MVRIGRAGGPPVNRVVMPRQDRAGVGDEGADVRVREVRHEVRGAVEPVFVLHEQPVAFARNDEHAPVFGRDIHDRNPEPEDVRRPFCGVAVEVCCVTVRDPKVAANHLPRPTRTPTLLALTPHPGGGVLRRRRGFRGRATSRRT